jgi:DNA-binding transcriptional regulator YiaG
MPAEGTLRQRLRSKHRVLGLIQAAMGALLGASRESVSKWENGWSSPDNEFLPLIEKVLSNRSTEV